MASCSLDRAIRRRTTGVVVLLSALLGSAPARADAVPPPPADCPAGSRGDSCHGGEYCAPARCTDDTSCSGDATCEELALCTSRIDCAGGWDPDAGPFYQDTVTGSCADGAACSSGACETVRVCVAASSPGTGGSGAAPDGSQVVEQGCGCRLSGPTPAKARFGAAGLLLGLCLGLRRRTGRVLRRAGPITVGVLTGAACAGACAQGTGAGGDETSGAAAAGATTTTGTGTGVGAVGGSSPSGGNGGIAGTGLAGGSGAQGGSGNAAGAAGTGGSAGCGGQPTGMDPNLDLPDPCGQPCSAYGYGTDCPAIQVCRIAGPSLGRCESCSPCGNLHAACTQSSECDILFQCYLGQCRNFCDLDYPQMCGTPSACVDVGNDTYGVCNN